jgi:hypothetical protein
MTQERIKITTYPKNQNLDVLKIKTKWSEWTVDGCSDGTVEINHHSVDDSSASLFLTQEELKEFIEFLQSKIKKQTMIQQTSSESEIKVEYDNAILSYIQVMPHWLPTQALRFRKDYTNNQMTSYDKVLQQMWQSNTGLQEWRDIPEED